MELCFKLRQCFSANDADGATVNVNCFLNSSCCAEGKIKDVTVKDDQSETDHENSEANATNEGGGDDIAKDILQSEASSWSSFIGHIGEGSQALTTEGKGVADEAINLHPTSERSQALSNA